MKVIKLGGSLLADPEALSLCLNTIEYNAKETVVIVPGGGVFADQVRIAQKQWLFNDEIAHEMAILAMQQVALLLLSLKPNFLLANQLSSIDNSVPVVIWSPDIKLLNLSKVEASWEVTSDSLAAWLATHIKADELILIKAAKIPSGVTFQQIQKQGIVDKAFLKYIKNAPYKITLLNNNSFNEYAFT